MKVAVLGAGIMGSGIAQLSAMAGWDAVARDPSADQRDWAGASIDKSLGRFVKAGKLDSQAAAEARERIVLTGDAAEALEGADAVIEAVPEVLDLKHRVLSEAVDLAPPEALLGSNTSQLSITTIAAELGEHAPRLVGIHFFNPPVMMRLVELIKGDLTRDTEVERAREFAVKLGKEVVVCQKDSPGFITSRAYAILRLECMRMLEEGVASAEDIDKALKLGFNFPMGPLELGDMNGLDTFMHALTSLETAYGDRYRPTVGLRNMVASNRIGRKAGAGFYEYEADGTRIESSGAD
jgi:3-hydroxybutyryl-CoA dehydrogenase